MPKKRKDGKPAGTLDKCPKKTREKQAYKALHKAGFTTVTKRGMPDFFAINHKGEFCLCVCKGSGQKLSKPQFLLFKYLSKHDVPCYYFSPSVGLRKFKIWDKK